MEQTTPQLNKEQGFKVQLKPSLKQYKAYQYLEDKETLALVYGGGAGGGKSWLLCEWIMKQAVAYPETKYFLAREKLIVLKKTTLITFFKVCKFHGLKKGLHYGYNAQLGVITFWNGSSVDLLELKLNPSDPMFEDVGSSEYTQGGIDEGGEVVFGAFDTMKSRIGRHLNDKYGIPPKILVTANPKKNWLYTMFYKPFKEGKVHPKYKFLPSLVDDNPYIESSYKGLLEELQDVSKRQRLLLGYWEYENDPSALIKYDNIVDLFTNPVTPKPSEKFVIVDVARFGGDKIVFTLYHGLVIKKLRIRAKQALTQTAKQLREFLVEHEVPYSHCLIDEDGVGGGLVDMLEGTKGFQANATPFDNPATGKPDNYATLKDQCGYKLAEYINAHKMRVELDIDFQVEGESEDAERFKEMLIEELEQIKQLQVDDDTKKKRLVPKAMIKEVLGRSPDRSDTMLMRMYYEFQDLDVITDEWGDDDEVTTIEEPSSFDLLKR